MFTGIVEELGTVETLEDQGDAIRLTVRGPLVVEDAAPGDSIAVNGVCLTVAAQGDETFTADVMRETLVKTSLGGLAPGARVNLERAVTASKRLGGHIVQGHVDGVGEAIRVRPEGDAEIWEFAAPEAVLRYCVEKGSICVDGISLTIVSVGESSFTVSILPQTRANTNFGELGVGSKINLEADVIGKYVERLLGPRMSDGSTFERSVGDAF